MDRGVVGHDVNLFCTRVSSWSIGWRKIRNVIWDIRQFLEYCLEYQIVGRGFCTEYWVIKHGISHGVSDGSRVGVSNGVLDDIEFRMLYVCLMVPLCRFDSTTPS